MCSKKSNLIYEGDTLLQNNNNCCNNELEKKLQYNFAICEETQKRTKNRRALLAQSLVTGAVMLSSASCGMPVGYSAILLPQLKQSNDSLQIDDEMGSWIASIHSAATPLGSLLSGLLMDNFGRRLALQVASLPLIVGWLLITLSTNHTLLLLGRVTAGLSAGLSAAAGQVLIGEISEPHLRGIFSGVPIASYSFGILLVYALGSLLPWRYVSGLSMVLPVTTFVILFFLPESPLWLVRNGKLKRARRALIWLRGGDKVKAIEECDHLVHRLESEHLQKETALHTLFCPKVLKPLLIINVFIISQILSGTYLIVYYAVDILNYSKEDAKLNPFLAAILTACVRLIFAVVGSFLLGFLGRRTLSITSGLGTSITSLLLGLFLHQNCQGHEIITAIIIFIYVAANTVGFMILPGVLLGELFPARVRGVASGLTFMLFNFLLFGTAKFFPFLKNMIGIAGIFWIFGISSLLGCLFLYLVLPETKSRSLGEIEDYFQQQGFIWVRSEKLLSNKETER